MPTLRSAIIHCDHTFVCVCGSKGYNYNNITFKICLYSVLMCKMLAQMFCYFVFVACPLWRKRLQLGNGKTKELLLTLSSVDPVQI